MPDLRHDADGNIVKRSVRDTVQTEESVWELGEARTRAAFDRFDHIVVLFSGGKDSTVVLQLAYAEAQRRGQRLRVVFFDEEAIPFQTEEYVRRVAGWDGIDMEWLCIPVKHRNACSRKSPWWWPWDPDIPEKWTRPLPPEGLTEYPGFQTQPPEARLSIPDAAGLLSTADRGMTGMLMGIRADESLTRRRAVTRRVHDNYIVKYDQGTAQGNLYKVYPIYDFKDGDVWRAPAVFGWDYNRAYDALEMAGVPTRAQRCSPAFGEEPLEKLWTYSVCFPEVWDKMTDRVPGAAAAARYALSELWSYRGSPDKPAGMPWSQFILHYADKFRPEDSRRIAERLRGEIRNHYRVTSDPMVEFAPHPASGVSWSFLLNIAVRGDFKNRKQAGARVDTRKDEQNWKRYRDELARLKADGRMEELR